MWLTSTRSVRANTVLLGLVFSGALSLVLLLAAASRLGGWSVSRVEDQGIALIVAVCAYLLMRIRARQAYEDARRAGHLEIIRGRAVLICDHPASWLIQLYLELHSKRLHVSGLVERAR